VRYRCAHLGREYRCKIPSQTAVPVARTPVTAVIGIGLLAGELYRRKVSSVALGRGVNAFNVAAC